MPAMPRSYAAVVKAAERAFRAQRIDHAFVGGVTVLAFGEPRTTTDVGVIARYGLRDAGPLAREFRRRGFRASAQDLRDALADRTHSTLEDTRSEYRVDLVAATRPAHLHAIAGRVTVRWRGMALPVAAPEHTVVMKIRYGSEQDLRDALGILVRQAGRLDVQGMAAFARDRGVLEGLRDLEQKARALGRRGRRG